MEGMVLLLGIDRFMSEARSITNTIGDAVGTMAIAGWVGALDRVRMQRVLDGEDLPEKVLYEIPDEETQSSAGRLADQQKAIA